MHFLLVCAAHPWSGLDPRAMRVVTAVELCFPGTGGWYSPMEWFTLLHCQVAHALLGLLINVMCNHLDEALWTWSYTWQGWVCSSSPAGFLCGIWKCAYPSHTSVLFTEKEKTGIMFLSPKTLGGEIVPDWEMLNLRGSEVQRCPLALSVIKRSCMESDALVSLIQKQMCEMCSYIFKCCFLPCLHFSFLCVKLWPFKYQMDYILLQNGCSVL